MENPRPVLSVKNVSMEFPLPLDGSSSLKEYLIKLFTGKNSSRILKALENIWLEVYEGEILGIIGTNGSGKSTLLKIIAGAITPTRGRVVTEEEKIQLLTLGTGFDRELTARENVFLNGALLGYSRSFLKERYPDIVKFAELEGFMEQKVKNFSSGMISRLGFAVAAASEKPGILILDEVLSVGDVFFKEKSTARIQELMKKGRAVLIVSHSTDTILRNCTRAVWIEKGVQKLTGSPQEVCQAYLDYGKKRGEKV
ncbi:MAG TPA: ABC transporter ATP-binding protein [Candidatus Blautia stercoripullorum]|uniref:ABC transporter ATP-binding protein n=1 Tax=Candidatus Blautia stercoripullorum TaxID=2838502 RepID=A0A9D2RB47_9FIRM|nr:ABC transporter ATP-binding protein [Candidatus Blautia stercoripullorum]